MLLLSQLPLNHSLETLFFCSYWNLLYFIVIILRYWSSLFHLRFLYLLMLLLNWFFQWCFVTLWLIHIFIAIRLLLLLIIFWWLRRIFIRYCRLITLNIFIRIRFYFLHWIWIVCCFLLDSNVLVTLWCCAWWFLSTHSCTIHFFLQ